MSLLLLKMTDLFLVFSSYDCRCASKLERQEHFVAETRCRNLTGVPQIYSYLLDTKPRCYILFIYHLLPLDRPMASLPVSFSYNNWSVSLYFSKMI